MLYYFTETLTAIFRTDYQVDFPYDPQELFIYALVGYFIFIGIDPIEFIMLIDNIHSIVHLVDCPERLSSCAIVDTFYLCERTKGSAHFYKKSNFRMYKIEFMKSNLPYDIFSRFIYPGLMSLFITTLYFPLGLGQFLASELSTRIQIIELFSNFTWVSDDLTVEQAEIVSHWVTDSCSIFVNLSIFMFITVSLLFDLIPFRHLFSF